MLQIKWRTFIKYFLEVFTHWTIQCPQNDNPDFGLHSRLSVSQTRPVRGACLITLARRVLLGCIAWAWLRLFPTGYDQTPAACLAGWLAQQWGNSAYLSSFTFLHVHESFTRKKCWVVFKCVMVVSGFCLVLITTNDGSECTWVALVVKRFLFHLKFSTR